MAKKSAIEKNNLRKLKVARYKNKRENLKSIIMDKNISPEDRFSAVLKLAQCPRNSASNRVRNRCAISGRPRGYYRKFDMSRIAVREFISSGIVPGAGKASW